MYKHDYSGTTNRYQAQRANRQSGRGHIAEASAIRAANDDKMAGEKAERIVASLPIKLNNAVIEGKQFLHIMPVDNYDSNMPTPPVVKKVMEGLGPFGVKYRIERRPDPSFPASHYLVARW